MAPSTLATSAARLAPHIQRRLGIRVFRFFARDLRAVHRVPPSGSIRALAQGEIAALATDPELNVPPEFLRGAAQRADVCVGAFDGAMLAGYCWLTFSPLPHLDGVWVRFGSDVGWIYKSFVRPAYRGRGTAPALYAEAERLARERGRATSLICVEAHNAPSVAAARRAGYRPAGIAGYVCKGGVFARWRSPGVRRHGIDFFLT